MSETDNGRRPRVPPVNLTYEEALQLASAKESFGWPPGSEHYMAFEAGRRKIVDAIHKAEARCR